MRTVLTKNLYEGKKSIYIYIFILLIILVIFWYLLVFQIKGVRGVWQMLTSVDQVGSGGLINADIG